MATVADLVGQLQSYTSVPSTILTTAIAEECVNTAIRRLQRVHGFRGEAWTTQLTVPAVTGTVTLPADFITETGVWKLDTSQTDPSRALSPIDKTEREFWIRIVDPTSTRDSVYPQTAQPGAADLGGPFYYLHAGVLHYVPKPSADVTVQFDYIRLMADLTGTQSNTFTVTYPDVVRVGALAEAYGFLHEFEVASGYLALFEARAREARKMDEAGSVGGTAKTRGA